MSTIKTLALKLSQETGRSAAVIEYGLKVGLYNLAGICGVALVGIAAGVLPYAMLAYVASGTLRVAGGGGHTTTPVRCIILTGVQFGLLGFIGYHAAPYITGTPLQAFSAGVLLSLLYAIIRFAPRATPNKPISEHRKKKLKNWALTIWGFWTFAILWALVSGLRTELVLPLILGLGIEGLSLAGGRKDTRTTDQLPNRHY